MNELLPQTLIFKSLYILQSNVKDLWYLKLRSLIKFLSKIYYSYIFRENTVLCIFLLLFFHFKLQKTRVFLILNSWSIDIQCEYFLILGYILDPSINPIPAGEFRGGGSNWPPNSISWFSSTPAGIGLKKWVEVLLQFGDQ